MKGSKAAGGLGADGNDIVKAVAVLLSEHEPNVHLRSTLVRLSLACCTGASLTQVRLGRLEQLHSS